MPNISVSIQTKNTNTDLILTSTCSNQMQIQLFPTIPHYPDSLTIAMQQDSN